MHNLVEFPNNAMKIFSVLVIFYNWKTGGTDNKLLIWSGSYH